MKQNFPSQKSLNLTYFLVYLKSGGGFSKDFSKVMTILANEVMIAGPIPGTAINIWLT